MSSEIDETLAKHDDWRDVKDPKKRKQIQDRLAQRARSKSFWLRTSWHVPKSRIAKVFRKASSTAESSQAGLLRPSTSESCHDR